MSYLSRSLIVNISQLLLCMSDMGKPLRGRKQSELYIIENAALLIENEKILDYGDSRHFRNLYAEISSLDACNQLAMPGLVDSHTHLVFSGTREDEFLARIKGEDYLTHLGKGKGILFTVEKTRNSPRDLLYCQAKDRLQAMLKHGTTSCEAKSGYGLDIETEIQSLSIHRQLQAETGMLLPSTLLAAHAVPAEFSGQPEAYLQFIDEELLPIVAHENLADFMDVFCEKNVFSAKQAQWILERARKLGLKPKLHTDEFFSIGGIQTAVKVGAVSADHLMTITAKDIELMSNSEVIGVILPGTSFNMAAEDYYYPRRLIDGNVPVALGTDLNPGTCMCYSMQIMLELSVMKMGLLIEEAIHAATINAAYACGIGAYVGSIEKGKKADILIMNVDRYQKIPYLWGLNKVKTVMLSGAFLDF